METKVTSHITKGLVLSLIFIVIGLVGRFTNLDLEPWFGWISLVILIAGIIWGVMNYGAQMNHTVSFGNLFAHGFKITAVIICITFVYTLLSVYVIFPDTVDRIIRYSIESGRMTAEQAQQNPEMIKKMTTVFMMVGAILGTAIIGAISALIGAAVTKKKPQDPFANQAI
jgi:hypothetical protein